MERENRIVVVLLVLAILFSVSAIYISYSALNFNLPNSPNYGAQETPSGNGAGNVNLVVDNSGGNLG